MKNIIIPWIQQTTAGFYRWELGYEDDYGTLTVEIFATENEARARFRRICDLEKLRRKQQPS